MSEVQWEIWGKGSEGSWERDRYEEKGGRKGEEGRMKSDVLDYSGNTE